MKTLTYLEGPYDFLEVAVERGPAPLCLLPGQDEDGYGNRITTNRKVRFGVRWLRVYATFNGNGVSKFVETSQGRLYLR